MHAAEHPGEGVSDGGFETVPGAADFLLLASVGQNNAVLCHLALLYGQPFGVLGIIRKEEECHNSDKDRDATFDDEEPLPARFVSTMSTQGLRSGDSLPVKACHTAHVVENASGEEARYNVAIAMLIQHRSQIPKNARHT